MRFLFRKAADAANDRPCPFHTELLLRLQSRVLRHIRSKIDAAVDRRQLFLRRYLPGRYLLAKNFADTNKTARDETQEPLVNDIESRLEVAVYPERNAMERVNNHRNPRAPSSQPAKQSRLDRMGVDDVIAPGSEQPIQLDQRAAIF